MLVCGVLTEWLWEEFTSKLIQVVEKIYFLAIVGVKFLFLAGCGLGSLLNF